MKNADLFIKELSNQELAFLKRYKINKYLNKTQEKIRNECITRNLSENIITEIINNPQKLFDSTLEYCPRCYSNKITIFNEELFNTSDEQAIDGAILGKSHLVEKMICQVCDYVIQDYN